MDVIVGKPVLTPEEVGFENVIHTEERFLPRILADLKIFKSASEVRKNRPDLVIELNKQDMMEVRIGKRVVWLLIGDK